ncbi:MAG: hypothetical protein IJ498_03690 [Akkermansia sp.]|nr:hypothetical protein [Akkermansia sp.]
MKLSATDTLFRALQKCDHATARRAIAAGADVNARDGYGCSPLRYTNSAEMCRLLLEAGAVPTTDDVVCAHYGEKLRLFVDWGVDVRKHRRMGETALWWALDADAARFLLEQGLSVHDRDDSGATALFGNIWSEVAEVLLAAGADLFVRDNAGNTLLHGTDARLGCWPLFLSAGLDVNARNKWGQTPLHRAECAESVELLMQYGADPTLRNNDGETPAEYWLEEENASFLADELPQMLKNVRAYGE